MKTEEELREEILHIWSEPKYSWGVAEKMIDSLLITWKEDICNPNKEEVEKYCLDNFGTIMYADYIIDYLNQLKNKWT